MLKITSIISSVIFLLFVGTGSYARTLVKVQHQEERAETNEKKDAKNGTDEGELDDEPSEQVYKLNVLDAFSLVNAQLRWKEFQSERSFGAFRFAPKRHEAAVTSLQTKTEALDLSIDGFLPIKETNCTSLEVVDAVELRSTKAILTTSYRVKTIAYILNCGTYPHG